MSENITTIFENQSPKSPLSPLKRPNSLQFDHILNNSKKQIYDNDKKVIVQDTPTPFMNRKIKSRIPDKDLQEEKKSTGSSIKITRRVIPNTPVLVKNNLSINSKKVKRLFDNRLQFLEEELPGNDDRLKLIDNGKKVSSLFKPRSVVEDNKWPSNDVSFENLEKKSRRRNPLIARLSDIEPPAEEYDKSNKEEIPSSPIIVSKKNNQFIDAKQDESQCIEIRPVQEPRVSIASKLTTLNYTNSFTNVSDINSVNQSCQENQNILVNNSESYSQAIDEKKIDEILFDGLKITDHSENKSYRKNVEKKFGLSDKTNTSKMEKLKIAKNSSLLNNSKKPKTKYPEMEVFFPKKSRTLNIAHLSLDENQKSKLKQIVKYMNCEYKRSSEAANAAFQNMLKSNTSHLVFDFEKVLCANKIKTIHKITIMLAIMRCCKIMRYEWLIHSELKREWCSEDQYTLESYIDIDLDSLEEDQSEFDIRLVKFERNLKLTDRIDLFSKYGNIFLLNCDSDNLNDVSLNDSFFKSSNFLFDYLHELITRCNGLITSRAACADLIVLIDTSDDHETTTKNGADLVLQHAIRFKKIFKEIKEKLIKCKIKKKISVVSSNWIIESILDYENKNLEDFVICCYEGLD